jgi:hypothetical protein
MSTTPVPPSPRRPPSAVTLQQAALVVFGILLGAAAAVWLLRAPHAPFFGGSRLQLGAATPQLPSVAQRQMGAPPAPKTAAVALPPPASCPAQAAVRQAGDKDGQYVLQSSVEAKTAADIPAFILAGKEAAAGGRSRDAEIAFLMACRVADSIKGSDSVESADARYQLGRHYATLATTGGASGANRTELLRRAEMLYSDSLASYQQKYGATHEKSRFAAEGLAGVLQVAAGQGSAPKVAAAAQAASTPPAGTARAPTPPAAVAAAPAPASVPVPAARPAPAPVIAAAPPAPLPAARPAASPPPVVAAAPRAPVPAARPPTVIAQAPAQAARPAPAAPIRAQQAAPVAVPTPIRVAPRPVAAPQRRTDVAIVEPEVRQATGEASFPSPSFDCARARSRPEHIICSDAALARMDRELGRLHARARVASQDPAGFRRQNDQEWRYRESNCRDRECLVRWYTHRREQLLNDIEQAPARNQPTAYR